MNEEKTFRVLMVDKRTGFRAAVYESGIKTEKEAQSICEAWGWNYIDEDGVSYWLEYEREDEENE